MSFDIAIYNRECVNGNQVTNSVKAAYLYGDEVRVYDNPRLQEYDQESISKLNDQKNDELMVFLEKYPSINLIGPISKNIVDGEFSRAFRELGDIKLKELRSLAEQAIERAKRSNSEILDNNDVVTKVKAYENEARNTMLRFSNIALREINIFVYKVLTELSNFKATLRTQSKPNYSNEAYYQELTRMNVQIIENKISVETVFDDYWGFQDRFINDKGFKIWNCNDSISTESMFPSMWVPSYLSEYAISSLPGFEEASVDEIIDIRKELNKYIVPYRAAMLKMAQTIKDIPDTESLQRECMALYLREIEPKVVTINTAINDNNVFKNIAKSIVTDEKTWASMGALATAFITTGDIANALSVCAAITFGGLSIAKSVISTLEEKKKIKDNEMFFLYQAGKQLKK